MTSKLFLTISLFVAFGSMNADNTIAEMSETAWFNHVGATASKDYFGNFGSKIASVIKSPYMMTAAVGTVLAGSTAVIGSVIYKNMTKPAAVESKPTYLDQAKNYANNAKVAVVEGAQKVQTAVVNGYDVAKKYTMDKPYHVAAGAAASVAALYAAYAWYNQEPALN